MALGPNSAAASTLPHPFFYAAFVPPWQSEYSDRPYPLPRTLPPQA